MVVLYYNDNASIRYSQQNLAARSSFGAPSVMNIPTSQQSVYSDGSQNGYMLQNNSMVDMYHPADEEIRREVQRITASADLMTMTKKQVREQLSRHFGVNMSYRKDFINHCIEQALNF